MSYPNIVSYIYHELEKGRLITLIRLPFLYSIRQLIVTSFTEY
jgi:hypothetical protein